MSTPFKIIAPVFILLMLAVFLLAERVPPRTLTATRMLVTQRRMLQFAELHNKLPATLAELPAKPGYDNATTDAWDRPLDFSMDAAGTVTLRSLGADLRPGGEGDDRDITGVFLSRDAEGHWQKELIKWQQDPLRP